MATACASSMSVEKSCASTAGDRDTKAAAVKTPSCSNRASCVLLRKKPVNPLAVSVRPPKADDVRQRVRSARMLKIRSLQSQLNDANYHLMELAQENRALKSTQRRQVKALDNYEGVNADLPRLIQSHSEENRALQERNRSLKRQLREATAALKVREDELRLLKDQHKQLALLAKDKHLEERAQLRMNLSEAKELIKNYEAEISVLNRKLALEVKSCRHKVNSEAHKFRKCQEQLSEVLEQLGDAKANGRLLSRRFDRSPGRERKSTINLTSASSKETVDSDAKLEPIKKRSGADAESRHSLASPAEKIKARLSGDARPRKIEDFHDVLEKLNMEEEHLKKTLQGGIKSTKLKATRLETLVQQRNGFLKAEKDNHVKDDADALPSEPFQPATSHNNLHFDPEQCDDSDDDVAGVEDDVQVKLEELPRDSTPEESPRPETPTLSKHLQQNGHCQPTSASEGVLQQHVENLHESEREFQRLQEEIEVIDKIEKQMNRNKGGIALQPDDDALVNEIWREEYAFRLAESEKTQSTKLSNTNNNHTTCISDGKAQGKKDPIVALENKRKLLATLREIDNGNSIEHDVMKHAVVHGNNNEIDSRKSRLMKELFG